MRTAGRVLMAVLAAGFALAAYTVLTVPDVRVLRTVNPTTTAFMELRAREARARGDPVRRNQRWVPYDRIANDLKRAVLVTEDAAFWRHEGLDLDEIRKSVEKNLEEGRLIRGASTITQQLAKNLYLSPSKDPLRKLRELVITRRLEAELTKRRILEIYLNVIEWGPGIYGAEAAAQTYFRKSAADLNASEAALLAAVIFSPLRLNPARPTPGLLRRQRLILERMGVGPPGEAGR